MEGKVVVMASASEGANSELEAALALIDAVGGDPTVATSAEAPSPLRSICPCWSCRLVDPLLGGQTG